MVNLCCDVQVNNISIKRLPDSQDIMNNHLKTTCLYCHGSTTVPMGLIHQNVSKSNTKMMGKNTVNQYDLLSNFKVFSFFL